MRTEQYESVEQLWADFTDKALREWRDEYWPRSSMEEAFSRHIRSATFACKRQPGGIYHLSYRIRCRQPAQDEWFFAKVSAVGGMYFVH